MTIARDIKTGAVVGQVLAVDIPAHRGFKRSPVLTKDGPKWISWATIRLEEISDR